MEDLYQINPPKKISEKIKCPTCGSIETAEVIVNIPWNSYIHTCKKCSYMIMESEWDVVEESKTKLDEETD